MRIPLEITENRIIFNASLLILHLGLRPLKFIVDTGSPKTFIGATDSIKLGIDQYVRESPEIEKIMMGKSELNLGILTRIKMYTKSDENKLIAFEIPRLGVVQDPLMLDKERQLPLPNIIGIDFIKENGLNLHYLSKENQAFFD